MILTKISFEEKGDPKEDRNVQNGKPISTIKVPVFRENVDDNN